MEQCQVVTRRGTRCSRKAKEGCAGFCSQHFTKPVKDEQAFSAKLVKVGKAGATIVTTATGLIKIIEFIVQHWSSLPFGSVDHGKEYRWLFAKLPRFLPKMPREYSPFSKYIDWVPAKQIYERCEGLLAEAENVPDLERASYLKESAKRIEDEFSSWFAGLQAPIQQAVYKRMEEEEGIDSEN